MSTTVVTALREAAGDSLRAVARYDGTGAEVVHERDDVAGKETAIDRIHEELVLQELGRGYLEDLFGVGRWQCTMHRFEEAVCLHYARGEFSGVFLSVDAGTGLDLESLVDLCHEHVE